MKKEKTTLEYIEDYPIDKIIPYEKNARINDAAVPVLVNAMEAVGNNDPIEVNEDGVILAGHTRLKALKAQGRKTARVLIVKGLTEEEQKAYRLEHNKTNEIAQWDEEIMLEEIKSIKDIDMVELGFNGGKTIDFGNLEDMFDGESNDEYEEFLDKFELKHTTDDCFTPPAVYDAILGWVRKTYGIDEKRPVVRPFYPGGDYTAEKYPKGCIVIDNPPFSITSQIVDYYIAQGIDFFLFCNGLTALNNLNREKLNLVLCHGEIVYENGAAVHTAFYTNLGTARIKIAGDLYALLDEVQPSTAKHVRAFDFPENMITSVMLARLAKYGTNMEITNFYLSDKIGGVDIFGKGGLVSDVMAEKLKAEKLKAEKEKEPVILSEREREEIARLNELEPDVICRRKRPKNRPFRRRNAHKIRTSNPKI